MAAEDRELEGQKEVGWAQILPAASAPHVQSSSPADPLQGPTAPYSAKQRVGDAARKPQLLIHHWSPAVLPPSATALYHTTML